jgi:SdrD B-like domain/LysM domain
MNKKHILITGIGLFLIIVLLLSVLPVSANSQLGQIQYQTPTPGTDGRIIYTVKAGDNCTGIAVLNGITTDQLIANNNLGGDGCQFLQEGQKLLIATVTVEPTSTTIPTPSGPTPTPFFGYGEICVLLFLDINGNGMAESTENSFAGGQLSVSDTTGQVSRTGTTDATGSPICFADLPEGDYNVSVAIPDGYNPTTDLNYTLKLKAGATSVLDFGAQPSSSIKPNIGGGLNRSPILAIFGGLLILTGIGLGFYYFRLRK